MKRLKPIATVMFVIYILCMLWLLFGRRLDNTFEGSYLSQLKSMPLPFQTVVQFGRIILTGKPAELIVHAWQNLVGNVAVFVPLGIFLPFFFSSCRRAKRTFLIGLLIIVIVEFTQFFTLLGSLDFDDVMLNTVGVMLGFGIWRLAESKIRD